MPAHLALPTLALGRRRLVLGAATAAVGAALAPGFAASVAADNDHDPLPTPTPIPGGLDLGPAGVIHVWATGEEGTKLPFSGAVLPGINYEPSTLTNFSGIAAVAFHAGKATDSDGTKFNLETDMRLFSGTYEYAPGKRRKGNFGLI